MVGCCPLFLHSIYTAKCIPLLFRKLDIQHHLIQQLSRLSSSTTNSTFTTSEPPQHPVYPIVAPASQPPNQSIVVFRMISSLSLLLSPATIPLTFHDVYASIYSLVFRPASFLTIQHHSTTSRLPPSNAEGCQTTWSLAE